MSDTKHTPGPWKKTGDREVYAVKSQPVATAWLSTCSTQEREANARLIAAAPDMLAALESIHKAILQYKMEHSDFGIDIGTIAVEAIAQATGDPSQ